MTDLAEQTSHAIFFLKPVLIEKKVQDDGKSFFTSGFYSDLEGIIQNDDIGRLCWSGFTSSQIF